jgi:hypothetical protein
MGRGKSQHTINLIAAAYAILEQIQPASVRAVCYKLFTLGILSSMSKNETNKVSTQLTWAREEGRIPWEWIVDETREPEYAKTWKDPATFLEAVRRGYRRDRWQEQPEWIEVWSEKGTIRGTLAPILRTYGVTFRCFHGYGSATALDQAAQDSLQGEKLLTVFYLGDYDPSGLHMSEVDLPFRLQKYGGEIEIIRLALTPDDVGPNTDLPAFATDSKRSDQRYRWYRECYGRRCWELDALDPNVLRDRLEQAIVQRLDRDAWERADLAEAAEQESMRAFFKAWPAISRPASKYRSQ